MADKKDPGVRVAKVFGVDATRLEEPIPPVSDVEVFVEEDPRVVDVIRQLVPSGASVGRYLYRLFPFLSWIMKYNWTWFVGDLIAGTTVGAVVVPQSMAYAQLAELPVEYGLYSSFMGVLLYWFFATSKDITIGPVAVMSQVTGDVVVKVVARLPEYEGREHLIASALAVITGAIIVFLGLARLGWIVEVISLPAICAFMTGSALNIAAGQVPKLMGIKGVETRGVGTHQVIIDTLKGLPKTKLDAAIGLTALAMLYLIRFACTFMAKKQPQRAKTYFFISTLRTAFVILLYTGISAGMNLHHREKPVISIVKDVPSGFQHAAVPEINTRLINGFTSELPAAVIVMLIEHISISKSFGRINNYVIDPSQELVAIGVTNLLAPFLGAYPATGSFSRTAIKSKAGVRTPFAGVITAIVVLLALYALTAVFFYIPNAGLAAVIIHAVGDVITPLQTVYGFWRVAPLDVVIFLAGVFVTVFTTIEIGIYVTVATSFAVLIWRLFLSSGRFLGRTTVQLGRVATGGSSPSSDGEGKDLKRETFEDHDVSNLSLRPGFLPLEHEDGSNPGVPIQNPYPGVFVYRFAEGFNYPNASRYVNHLTEVIFKLTRRTDPSRLGKLGDRPWNDSEPRHVQDTEDTRPTLKAIVLDFSSVNNIDATSVQTLLDTRNQLDRYAAPDHIDWHFANITNRWTRRGLAAAGFGIRRQDDSATQSIFSFAELGGDDSAAAAAAATEKGSKTNDIESAQPTRQTSKRQLVIQGLNRPLFHFDLQEAVEAAVADAKTKIY